MRTSSSAIAKPVRGRPPRSETAAAHARAKILAAADKLFAKGGYEGVSMRGIAKAAGCSLGAVYTLFPNKRAILRGIGDEAFDALDRALARATNATDAAIDRLNLLGVAYVKFWRARPDDFRTLFLIEDRVIDPGERYFVDTSKSLGRVVARFMAPAEEAITAGEINGEARAVVELIFCALHGVCSGIIAMPEYRWHVPDKMAGEMMEALLAGMAPKSSPGFHLAGHHRA